MLANILFYTLIALQLWLISHYYAKRLLTIMGNISDNYTEEEYPKLYPKTKQSYLLTQQRFKRANQIILALGVTALFIFIWKEITQGYQPPSVAALIFMVQLMPFFMLELSEYSYFNAVRKQNHQPVRTTSLSRRSLSDYVSVKQQWGAILLLVIAIALDLLLHLKEPPLSFGVNHNALVRSGTLILSNLVLLVLVLINVYGKKIDPFQNEKARLNQIRLTVQTLFYISISMTIFFLLKSLLVATEFTHFQAVITTIYMIIIAYVSVGHRVRCSQLNKINFDNYKA